jgi:hypothetical protein
MVGSGAFGPRSFFARQIDDGHEAHGPIQFAGFMLLGIVCFTGLFYVTRPKRLCRLRPRRT